MAKIWICMNCKFEWECMVTGQNLQQKVESGGEPWSSSSWRNLAHKKLKHLSLWLVQKWFSSFCYKLASLLIILFNRQRQSDFFSVSRVRKARDMWLSQPNAKNNMERIHEQRGIVHTLSFARTAASNIWHVFLSLFILTAYQFLV